MHSNALLAIFTKASREYNFLARLTCIEFAYESKILLDEHSICIVVVYTPRHKVIPQYTPFIKKSHLFISTKSVLYDNSMPQPSAHHRITKPQHHKTYQPLSWFFFFSIFRYHFYRKILAYILIPQCQKIPESIYVLSMTGTVQRKLLIY